MNERQGDSIRRQMHEMEEDGLFARAVKINILNISKSVVAEGLVYNVFLSLRVWGHR